MSTLVKSSDGILQGRIRAFRRGSPASETATGSANDREVRTTEPVGLDAAGEQASPASEAEILLTRIEALETELERARSEAELKCEERYGEGRAAGLLEAERAERDRLEIIGQAAATLPGKVDEACKSLEALGASIAGVAIGKVLGDKQIYRQAIGDCIAIQMAAIRPELVSRLRLSADDFPDETAVALLGAKCGLAIELDPQLEAGACLFDLSLGRLDASLGRQREAIVALLDEIAEGPGE
jgi:type III secretion protein L